MSDDKPATPVKRGRGRPPKVNKAEKPAAKAKPAAKVYFHPIPLEDFIVLHSSLGTRDICVHYKYLHRSIRTSFAVTYFIFTPSTTTSSGGRAPNVKAKLTPKGLCL